MDDEVIEIVISGIRYTLKRIEPVPQNDLLQSRHLISDDEDVLFDLNSSEEVDHSPSFEE